MLNDEAVEQFVLRVSEVQPDGSVGGAKPSKKNKLDSVGSIRENETMKEFNKRINNEVKRVIYDESKKTRRKSEKRKEFLNKKKEKERVKKMTDQERYEREFQATGSTKKDTFAGPESVRFGDRVDAPPILPKLSGIFQEARRSCGEGRQECSCDQEGSQGVRCSFIPFGQRAALHRQQTRKSTTEVYCMFVTTVVD
ncbi:hypothetical protein PINS_up011652 [Pythium insidiosum]|nr:hypothetical protein PINS_up011652 [Pythium insidiosum]